MQINVTNVHLPIPTINHNRLAHQFPAIIRIYGRGCSIILHPVSLPSVHGWFPENSHTAALTSATLFLCNLGWEVGEISEYNVPVCPVYLRDSPYLIRDSKKWEFLHIHIEFLCANLKVGNMLLLIWFMHQFILYIRHSVCRLTDA